MTVVVDASALVAALVDSGSDGEWAREQTAEGSLIAPAHVFVEATNVLRRGVLTGWIGREVATLAHQDLIQLPLTTFGYEPLATRVWELHPTITAHDAAYVALAEEFGVPLVTLDRRLSRASGPTCGFRIPD